jgi:hypothetical protein
MDPISTIVTALTAGAAGALEDAVAQTVKNAYLRLRALLARRGASPEVLDGHAEDPQTWDTSLRAELERVGAGHDEEIVGAARELRKYIVTITDSKGIVIGDHATVTMHFEDH